MDPLTRYAGALPKGEPALSPATRELSRRASLPSHPLRGSSPGGRAFSADPGVVYTSRTNAESIDRI